MVLRGGVDYLTKRPTSENAAMTRVRSCRDPVVGLDEVAKPNEQA